MRTDLCSKMHFKFAYVSDENHSSAISRSLRRSHNSVWKLYKSWIVDDKGYEIGEYVVRSVCLP